MKFQMVLLVLLGSFNFAHGQATSLPVTRVSNCQMFLGSGSMSTVHAEEVFRLFNLGLDDESEAIGYAPLSQKQLVELIIHGRFHEQFHVFVNRNQEDQARSMAHLTSTMDLIRGRLLKLDNPLTLPDPELRRLIINLIGWRFRDPKVSALFTPTESELSMAMSGIRFLGPDLSAKGNKSRRAELLKSFSDLPAHSGFVVALSRNAKANLKLVGKNFIGQKMELSDILGIDANSEADFRFLDDLSKRSQMIEN